MPDTTVVHLLRHGEVSNPRGVLYGRLPGYHLSPEGEHMAKAAAAFLAGRDVTLLLSSPLERALETAAPARQLAAPGQPVPPVVGRAVREHRGQDAVRHGRRRRGGPRARGGLRQPSAAHLGGPPGGRGAPAVAPPGPPRVRPWQRDQLHLHRRQDHRRQLRRTVRRRTRRGPRRLTPVEPRTGLSVGAPGQPRTEIREVVSGLLWVPDSPGFTGQSGIRHNGARHYRL